MPYVAPEVLLDQKYTQAADIYALGVIMVEISTGKRPYVDYPFNTGLALKICNGLQPEFASETPDCYIELAKQCMNLDLQKRPTAEDVRLKLVEWYNIIESEESNDIKKKFLDADKNKQSSIIYSSYSDFRYTSKIINTQEISKAYDSIQELQIPEDI